jgi:hypothetical protein
MYQRYTCQEGWTVAVCGFVLKEICVSQGHLLSSMLQYSQRKDLGLFELLVPIIRILTIQCTMRATDKVTHFHGEMLLLLAHSGMANTTCQDLHIHG